MKLFWNVTLICIKPIFGKFRLALSDVFVLIVFFNLQLLVAEIMFFYQHFLLYIICLLFLLSLWRWSHIQLIHTMQISKVWYFYGLFLANIAILPRWLKVMLIIHFSLDAHSAGQYLKLTLIALRRSHGGFLERIQQISLTSVLMKTVGRSTAENWYDLFW